MSRPHAMRAPEEYAAAAEQALAAGPRGACDAGPLAQAYATLSVTATLLQVRDQLSILVELVGADPGISHVIAARQIIAEMHEAMSDAGLT